jgi:hypothetical protein
MNAGAMYEYGGVAEVEFCVYSPDGRMAAFSKIIAPNSAITFSVAELLKDAALLGKGHFTLWIYCRNRVVQAFHILKRKKDGAVGIQHFYHCRFNIPEQELPFQAEIAETFHRHTGRRIARMAFSVMRKARDVLRKLP